MLKFRQKKAKQAEKTRHLMKNPHNSGDIGTYMEENPNKTKFSSSDL